MITISVEPFKDKHGNTIELDDIKAIVTGSVSEDANELQWILLFGEGKTISFNSYNPEEKIIELYNENPDLFKDKVRKADWKFLSLSGRNYVICIDCGHVVINSGRKKRLHKCNGNY